MAGLDIRLLRAGGMNEANGTRELREEQSECGDDAERRAHRLELNLKLRREDVLVSLQLVRAPALDRADGERSRAVDGHGVAHPIAPLSACTMPAAANEKNAPMAIPFTCSRACGSPLKYFIPATMQAATPTTDA